jgi:hypothetical protein
MDNFNNETMFSDIKNTINYVITNYHKFLLLIFAVVIIYFVDHITYINSIIYSSPSVIPVLPGSSSLKKSRKTYKK